MPETPEQDLDAIRRRARARAVRMGHAKPEPEAPPAAPVLPKRLTDHPGALRGMLLTGRLSGEQAASARAFLADLAAKEGQSAPAIDFPEDAA